MSTVEFFIYGLGLPLTGALAYLAWRYLVAPVLPWLMWQACIRWGPACWCASIAKESWRR